MTPSRGREPSSASVGGRTARAERPRGKGHVEADYGAIIGITLVWSRCLLSIGVLSLVGSDMIYRQFSVTWWPQSASPHSMALSLTPSPLRRVAESQSRLAITTQRRAFLAGSPPIWRPRRRGIAALSAGRWARTGRIDAALYRGCPRSFLGLCAAADGILPIDDQGFNHVDVGDTSRGAFNRTLDVVKQVEDFLLNRNGVRPGYISDRGSAFSARAGTPRKAFVTTETLGRTGPNDSAEALSPTPIRLWHQ